MFNNHLNLYLIRHGLSEDNQNHPDRVGQAPSVKLTDLGRLQASLIKKYFNQIDIDQIYSSTYDRAKETAQIFAQSMKFDENKIIYSDALREYSPGDYTGRSRKEILTSELETERSIYPLIFSFPNGESIIDVQYRAIKFLKENVFLKDYKNVIVFSHGVTIKAIIQIFMNYNPNFIWNMEVSNTGICHLSLYNNKCYIKSINDISHLK